MQKELEEFIAQNEKVEFGLAACNVASGEESL